jgi:CRISPR-associated protein Cas1
LELLIVNDNYHIFSDGRIERHNDTVRLVNPDDEKSYLPIETAEALFLHGQIDFNTRLMSFLNDHGVAVHVFGWNDYYAGSVMPERGQTSGRTVVEQVRAYDTPEHRRSLARKFIRGSIHNMRANVSYYDGRSHEFGNVIERLDAQQETLGSGRDVSELMGVEATARRAYYSILDDVLPDGFVFGGRQYNPPDNEVNSLISFANSLVYANVVSAIRATALDPAVSFVHEPGDRRYSLALDIADIFKPVLADRVIFRVVNRSQLTLDEFETDLNSCLLTESGRKTVSKAFEETLNETIEHPRLNRKVSYQYLLRIEAYKLKKHLLTGEEYVPFERWW